MRVKFLDKGSNILVRISMILFVFLGMTIVLFTLLYNNFTIYVYEGVFLIIIFLIVILLSFFITIFFSILYVYKRKPSKGISLRLTKFGFRIFMKFIGITGKVLNIDKMEVQAFYIKMNNILVSISMKKYNPEEVLIILPHCLQNSECTYKITTDIEQCRNCGKCVIGKIVEITRNKKIKTLVATGGTAARNAVMNIKPKVILSVACERDLASGIEDVKFIPVVGILNERPNGPCFNTTLNLELFEKKLEEILK